VRAKGDKAQRGPIILQKRLASGAGPCELGLTGRILQGAGELRVGFSLTKWYLDLVTDDGRVAIAYWAEVRWKRLRHMASAASAGR